MLWQPEYIDAPLPDDWILLSCHRQFLSGETGLLFPRAWVERQDLIHAHEHGLGYFSGRPVYLWVLTKPQAVPGASWNGLRHYMLQIDDATFHMLSYAAQIANWLIEHRYCGHCGQSTQLSTNEHVLCCTSCQSRHYPRLSPSMIVLVTRADQVLLARSTRFVSGTYSTLAGFVEPGESVEQCVRREVREEVGLELGALHYIASQNWPFPHSLMLGFHAEYLSGDIIVQEDEIEDARWFAIDQLPPLPIERSIARYLIELYKARRLGLTTPVLPD